MIRIVVEDADETRGFRPGNRADGKKSRENAAVLTPGMDLTPRSDDVWGASCHITFEAGVVGGAILFVHEHANVAADYFPGFVAKKPLGRATEALNRSSVI